MKKNLKLLSIVVVVALMLTGCQKEYTITAMPDYAGHGTVIGGGVYKKGTVIQLAVVPATGYSFDKWEDGNAENPRSITVQTDAVYIATFTSEGGGGEKPTNMGIFSVSATQKVYFSPGNLQWSASGSHAVAGDGTAAGTWRFAPNQWYNIGANNKNIDSAYTGWIDLFGWATSGYDNKYPYITSTYNSDYSNNENDITGTNYDWGVYNAIYNPQTRTTDAPGTWRTLTKDEWDYLLNTRTTSLSGICYAKSTVCGITGVIIVPDNWNASIYTLNNVNTSNVAYTSNIIGETDWEKMEAAGCVFLPAAGYREETSIYDVGSNGSYWSTTYFYGNYAYNLDFYPSYLYPSYGGYPCRGRSVRLVKDVK